MQARTHIAAMDRKSQACYELNRPTYTVSIEVRPNFISVLVQHNSTETYIIEKRAKKFKDSLTKVKYSYTNHV